MKVSMQARDERFQAPGKGTALEVLFTFLKLGLTSFGGPVAHIGYYRLEIVEKKRWISENQFAQLLAICQFLPGPASSQFGFSVGLLRAGWLGAIAAFVAFTLPSAALLVGFAFLLPYLSGTVGDAAIHGLKLVALAFVAHAVFAMNRQLCPDPSRQTMAVVSAATVLVAGSAQVQIFVIALAALAGLLICRNVKTPEQENLKVGYGVVAGWLFPVRFTGSAHWYSAAATWCCHCSSKPWLRPAGCLARRFWPATAPPRPYRVHCSLSRPILEPSCRVAVAAYQAQRWHCLRSSCRAFCWFRRLCRFGKSSPPTRQPGEPLPVSMPQLSDFWQQRYTARYSPARSRVRSMPRSGWLPCCCW